MATRTIVSTFYDVVDDIIDQFGGNTNQVSLKQARRAVMSALRIVPNEHKWDYYWYRGRVTGSAPYSTGTITYDHTGGASELQLTLASGTWPAWAARGLVTISSVSYMVDKRVSDSIITLKADSNPGADVAAGTNYNITQAIYKLPDDFQGGAAFRNVSQSRENMYYVPPEEWMRRHRSGEISNTPRVYTFAKHPDFVGAMGWWVYPPFSAADEVDYMYQRKPMPLRTYDYSTGTVTITQDSKTVTGAGTTWTSDMVGTVIRVGDLTNVPTGNDGLYPFVEERIVDTVDSATVIQVHDAWTMAFAALTKYRISTPTDVEDGAMYDAFLSRAALEMARRIQASSTEMRERKVAYEDALKLAMQADYRDLSEDVITGWGTRDLLSEFGTVTLP